MEVADLIFKDVLDKARTAFAAEQNWIAYNNTLLFVHETDIRFFANRDDAEDFCFDSINEMEKWRFVRLNDLKDFQRLVENEMPGIEYKPAQEMSTVAEEKPSFFPKQELLIKQKIIMTQEQIENNLVFLKSKLEFLGFPKELIAQVQEKMEGGIKEFDIPYSQQIDNNIVDAAIHFQHSEKDDKEGYFLNSYVASAMIGDAIRAQYIYVNNRGQSVTFKESCNLLNDRAVFKTLTVKEKDSEAWIKKDVWLKIDPSELDLKTGFPKLQQYNDKWGFDLKEAMGRLEFMGMNSKDSFERLKVDLEKGNQGTATLIKDGAKIPVLLEANPYRRTLNMYDREGKPLEYPKQKLEQKYGQAPVDAKKQELNVVNEPRVAIEKKDLLAKDKPTHDLMDKNKPAKKRTRANRIS